MCDEVSIKSDGKSANLLNLSGISEIIPLINAPDSEWKE
jgi:hypothetical protein